ncbi:hypothetical protein EJ05DRAFT_529902 [Pseudovirgaria hyperparasitica]|uniref:Zincin n=1 Tax=Pseudovirgaria hyperparasitica TaxID=470096 RepID=A0A6A6WI48_9PEZI|nr:uncharacterized protein EJ05DRAFT_529902 [Pseudovirgaria hyperparasitica]KAF2762483.1 hypothetical protein EJ05DRAFT_529902 [Pseudovirgaria hyperparasitica]
MPSVASRISEFTSTTSHKDSQRVTAASSGPVQARERAVPDPNTFPGPLVLPYDDLADDPKWPPQPFKAWRDGRWRNPVTPERRTIYLAAPPTTAKALQHVYDWAKPNLDSGENGKKIYADSAAWPGPGWTSRLQTEVFISYIAAFYHPLPVKILHKRLKFVPWENDQPKTKRQRTSRKEQQNEIAIATDSELIQIRNRPCPDDLFPRQLNLCDLLDVAIEVLPADAYALLMLTDHDIFENEADDFCCGRAFGGSRVAVVSTARYLTELDAMQDIDHVHSWPASHCAKYVNRYCDLYSDIDENDKKRKEDAKKLTKGRKNGKAKGKSKGTVLYESSQHGSASPMRAAISVYNENSDRNLLMARVARTACHELGHCFGIDHCVYYACSMQGTSSAAEDARQPPYLCPVDLEKVLHATGGEELSRYDELLKVFLRQKRGDEGYEPNFFRSLVVSGGRVTSST